MGEPAQWPGTGPTRESEVDRGFNEDFDEWAAWLDREVAAGRDPTPPERVAAQGISVSLGDAAGVDPGLLAAISGADDAGLDPQFAQNAAADVLPPGPVLAALTEGAVADVTRLSDDQLIGVLQASRRQQSREAWKQALLIAEFARRRAAALEAAAAAGTPVHCRPGQFPGEELMVELLLGPAAASHAIDDAEDLTTRLPRTLAGMAAGLIDEPRAGVIAMYTRSLDTDDVAFADEILAALAPTLRLDQLMGKAAALEKKLNPEAVKARREHARRTGQRVEVHREESGNASVAGREMDTSDALAAKAHIHALALRLRRAGLPGTLDQLRLLVFTDLTAGRDPVDRLTQGATSDRQDSAGGSGEAPPDGAQAPGLLDYQHDEDGGADCADDPGLGPRPPAPMPAMINLVVHAGTLFGWDTTPTEVGGWGPLDADETRAPAPAPEGQHDKPPGRRPPDPADAARLGAFLRGLNVIPVPIDKGNCGHAAAEPGYTPSRKLAHLVRARTVTCDAPGCAAQAVHADLDHTIPYPEGPTDQCNLSPKCRRHHRAKQSPGWEVEQPAPDVIRWTLPSGRTHTTRPTNYFLTPP
jgi:hypothetical protein